MTDRKLGYQIGLERAAIDKGDGIRQNPDQLWHPHHASTDYVAGLTEGYRDGMDNKPKHLEDVA
ncbi:hypothetical protein [Oleispirillum naphthae]|uniref:hypothetical protein n=1 Tax=Oleispirillum naphthae TaxID=2838853 RepID=UPI00308249BB